MNAEIGDITIGRLGGIELARLIAIGEPGGVEFKGGLPKKDGLAPSVAAFANSGGGWLLLGVEDDGKVCGFTVPGSAGAHDWLRDILHPAIDPLPEFWVATVPTADGDVFAIRIPPSSNTPHVLRRSGVVYERLPGGKRPIDSQHKLVVMCEEPRLAEERARDRLTTLRPVQEAFAARMHGPQANGETRVAEWYVGATPLQLPVGFEDALLTEPSVGMVKVAGAEALSRLTEGGRDLHSRLTTQAFGYVIDGSSLRTRDELTLTVDSGGAAVARWSTRIFRGTHHLPGLGDHVLLPLLRLVAAALVSGQVESAIRVEARLTVTPRDSSYGPFHTVHAATETGELSAPRQTPQILDGRLTSPSEAELRRQADAWWRQFGRAAGLELWESARR